MRCSSAGNNLIILQIYKFILKAIYLVLPLVIFINITLHAGISFTLVRTISLERLEDINYDSMYDTFDLGLRYVCEYSLKNGDIFLICKKLNQKSIKNKIQIQVTESKVNADMVSSVEVFDSDGNHKGHVGMINSYNNGGIINPTYMTIDKNSLYILDSETNRINKFEPKQNSYIFMYSISYKDKFDGYYIKIIDNMLYTSNPKQFLSHNNNSGIIFEIVDDPYYDNSMDIIETGQIIPVNEFRSFFGFGNNELEGVGDFTPSMIETIKTRGLYSKVRYTNDPRNRVYAINAFGTEINKIDDKFNIIQKNRIQLFEDIRKEEKNIKERTSVHWNDLYSECNDLFYHNNSNSIILYYRFSKDISDNKGYKRALLFLSAETLEPISDMIPIEFVPIQVNQGSNELIALNFINKHPVIEFYEINK